ncbi:efflux RND transporter permease subunit [Methyloceanibacter caenitepidi]|uniref:efflux RND transporter permease subunit n=1 Tax=Methyloceanibacter caenitepidi TaxID=1384459 RepID=UPI0009E2631D|nr:MMPL family transporter [Methyloceanibacter caenitepidi]
MGSVEPSSSRGTPRLTLRVWLVALWTAVLVLDAAALLGASKLRYEEGLDVPFSSSSQRYQDYVRFKEQFTPPTGDVAILFTAKDLAEPEILGAIQDFTLDAQLIDGVADVYSIFALREPSPNGDSTLPIIPEPLPDRPALTQILDDMRALPTGLGRFVSADRTMTAVVVTLAEPDAPLPARKALLSELQTAAAEAGPENKLQAELTGLPILRETVIASVFKDTWTFTAFGMLCGFLVCAAALRSITLAVLVLMPSGTALLWTLGVLGFAGYPIGVLTVALPALVAVLSFTDTLHLTFEMRRLRDNGVSDEKAPLEALRRVGPACALASITTAAAFAGLTISTSAVISGFGVSGLIAALVSLAAVVVTCPMLFTTIAAVRPKRSVFAGRAGMYPAFLDLGPLADFTLRHYRPILVASFLCLVATAVAYTQIAPNFSIHENIDADEPAFVALKKMDSELIPTGIIDIPVRLAPRDNEYFDGEALARVKAVHAVTAAAVPDAVVVSVQSLLNPSRSGDAGEEVTEANAILAQMTETQRGRFVSRDGDFGLVRVAVPNHEAAHGRETATALETALKEQIDRGIVPGATGLLLLQSFISGEMIRDLNTCFLMAVVLSGLLIAYWFRSGVLGLVALVPNVLPILAVGAFLAVSGWGLEYASGVALTIAFGLAVDDTVHVLNRLRLNADSARPYDIRVIATSIKEVAPVLVITSAVLALGMAGLFFSSLPTLRYFGGILIAVFVMALIADLVVLPALLRWLDTPSLFRRPWRTA